jgi:hypothetical protein
MATWKKVITSADDASYSNSSIEAGNVPTLNQNTTGSSATCTGNSATATKIASISNSEILLRTDAQTITNKNIVYTQITSAPWTTNTGDITSVTAGTGMSGGGTSGSVTLTNASPNIVYPAETKSTINALDITEVGIINSGEWRGTVVDPSSGGTGLTSTSTLLNSNVTSVSGNAGSATVLANTRTFRTNLSSTSFANFNGGANVTPGVTGTLPVSYGGTGQTGATGSGKLVLWDSPNLQGSPIIGGTTMPSSSGTAKQVLSITGTGSASWTDNYPDNVRYFYQQWSMRWYMRYGYAYYPSTSYGPGYYNWNKYSISPITSWLDSWNLGYVVPESATFKGAELLGSTNNTETLQLKILKGTPSSYSNSSASVTIGSIYAPTAASFTSGRRKSMGSTSAVSVSVSKGDIIVPQLNKTSNINSTTRYLYGTLVLRFQKA